MHTGVALRRADGTRAWRTWELVGVGGIRLNKFEDRLRALHETERFVRVSYEGVYHGPNNIAVGVLRHFEAIILNWTARVGLPCWAYSASEIKRAVATGRADKRR